MAATTVWSREFTCFVTQVRIGSVALSSDYSDSQAGSHNEAGSAADQRAYLVLQSAGRWSDVFRLSPPAEAVIGRTSANQIVIRSDQASRRHARIFWSDEAWNLEDLGSRNGTFLNGQRIAEATGLRDTDLIDVAGYTIQFTRRIEGSSANGSANAGAASQVTDDQITMEMDPDAITDRRRHSHYLRGGISSASSGPGRNQTQREQSQREAADASARQLLQLAFTLARCDQASAAVDIAMDLLADVVQLNTVGAYVTPAKKSTSGDGIASVDQLSLVAARQSGQRSYRRPPDGLVKTVAAKDGQAVLARNVLGDRELATENSHGEIDVESVILSPVRDRDGVLRGLLHLTTAGGEQPMASDDLEFVVATSEILAECLSSLSTRKKLSHSLRRSRQKIRQLQEQLGDKVQIIGNSESVEKVIEQVSLVAPTNTTVLVRGESGVGKELVAAAIHHSSSRRDGPLVCMNCAALSSSLLESELFGHEKGAFTGATDRKQGKFEMADGGTLMLDEIGEMSEEIQAKFLRVLEGHAFERVGGQNPIKVDVRVIAATNRDLQAMVTEGEFRQDLFYRLHVVEIVVPPLRKRGKDVLHLAGHFLQGFNRDIGRKIEGFTEAAQKRLLTYSWPGNVRELKNVIERAVVLNTKQVIDDVDLSLSPAKRGGQIDPSANTSAGDVEVTLAEIERNHIETVLRHTGGNKSRASSILGIERSTLDRKLKRFAKDDA
ncbi:Transcriptional regulatory protein ZraR [Planctomycetes bacterium K23_9]|uniref:Transcriptional regulatory protein ZraR n=1 Tax=Stieleria marina TaxID=1930275 RepID=A0A517NXK5_9BACT|nr:Transcriptional regulatory protein ZraR [Planctomycetes bacterium K23_9]